MIDDRLTHFEASGASPLPPLQEAIVAVEGASIWTAAGGEGSPVVLLHGGLGHSGNWGYQAPFLIDQGYRIILVDSRGHGRSTRDNRPYSYTQMAKDLQAVLNAYELDRAAILGWSDGAVIGLVLAQLAPGRISRLLFFGCNVDPSGTKALEEDLPILNRCFKRHALDYARLSATPGQFNALVEAVTTMQETQPNLTAADLRQIDVPVTVMQAEHDEFIKAEHAAYIASTLPNAKALRLPGVSHFAPLQRPEEFNLHLLEFLSQPEG